MRPILLINKDTLINSENRIIIFIHIKWTCPTSGVSLRNYAGNFATGRSTTIICEYLLLQNSMLSVQEQVNLTLAKNNIVINSLQNITGRLLVSKTLRNPIYSLWFYDIVFVRHHCFFPIFIYFFSSDFLPVDEPCRRGGPLDVRGSGGAIRKRAIDAAEGREASRGVREEIFHEATS